MVVRKRNFDLIYDIIRLQSVENREVKEIVDRLSEKYSVDDVTIYRNISEVDSYIQERIRVLKMLQITALNEEEFKDAYEKVKNALT